jgi:excinuclease UvrABC nuclease subunit
MTDDLTALLIRLNAAMAAAADTLDFEQARRLRDRISLLRGGTTPEVAAATDTS